MKSTSLRTLLFGLSPLINRAARKNAPFLNEAIKHNCVLQIKIKNNKVGRHFTFLNGKVTSASGIHPNPDVAIVFKNLDTALNVLRPDADISFKVHAAKNFLMTLEGPDYLANWVLQLIQRDIRRIFLWGKNE